MGYLNAARFISDPNFEKCLAGTLTFAKTIGSPEVPSVARLQLALNHAGVAHPALVIDGKFGDQTEIAVRTYREVNGLPAGLSVDAVMMKHLDDSYADEIARNVAKASQATPFGSPDPDVTLQTQADGTVTYATTTGVVQRQNGVVASFLPARAAQAVATVKDISQRGAQLGGPHPLNPEDSDEIRWLIEFEHMTLIFPTPDTEEPLKATTFIPRDVWEASVAGLDLIGLPKRDTGMMDSPVPGARVLEHEKGVVLATEGFLPQPLTTAIYEEWVEREMSPKPLGPPDGFAFLAPDGLTIVYPFRSGRLPDES